MDNNAMFSPGDKVTVMDEFLSYSPIADMLEGKIGTVIGPDDHPESPWDVVVYFPDTPRVSGTFAFFNDQLKGNCNG